MTNAIRVRATTMDGTTDVHVLMMHPMETGLRKDESGNYVPAHYIADVQITVAGRLVLAATLGRGVSQDPLLHFRFRGGTLGERVVVQWTDSKGATGHGEGVLA